jgi:hypothetical protein
MSGASRPTTKPEEATTAGSVAKGAATVCAKAACGVHHIAIETLSA